jgi:hypothetical protein
MDHTDVEILPAALYRNFPTEEHTTKLYEEIYSHLPKQEREKTIKASETISSFLHPPTAKRVEALLR